MVSIKYLLKRKEILESSVIVQWQGADLHAVDLCSSSNTIYGPLDLAKIPMHRARNKHWAPPNVSTSKRKSEILYMLQHNLKIVCSLDSVRNQSQKNIYYIIHAMKCPEQASPCRQKIGYRLPIAEGYCSNRSQISCGSNRNNIKLNSKWWLYNPGTYWKSLN